MSFYNFKLNDPSSFSTSNSSDFKAANRFVHKTYEDYNAKNDTTPKPQISRPQMTNDGRGKFAVQGWKERNIPSPIIQERPQIIYQIPEEIRAVSISSSLQAITHIYAPINIATLHSMRSSTSVRIVKLGGQSTWHSHDDTDEIFILLRGGINMLYKSGSGQERVARVIGGELLCVPMRMEHCVVADEGTEVLLLEGSDVFLP
jgi:mannose-6-phosphate isomerase-like protein (cupin superfamily)